jgi:pilus assembly protein CpaB
MKFQRTGALVVALALAILGTIGLTAYVHSAKDRAVSGEKLVDVYVASGKIAAGTPATDMKSHVKLEHVPAKVRATDAVTNLSQIKGRVASIDIADGEQILNSRFVSADAQAARVQSSTEVPAGLFQSTVSLDPDQALGGQVRAGNRVAVVAIDTTTQSANDTPNVAKVIVRNVLVTTVQIDGDRGQGTNNQSQQVANAPTGKFLVTVALNSNDLPLVVAAVNNGKIWLAADPGTK